MVEMFGLNRPLPTTITATDEEPVEVGDQQQEQAERHDRAAEQDRRPIAEVAIGDEAAEDAGRVDQCGVGAVGQAGLGLGLAVRQQGEERSRRHRPPAGRACRSRRSAPRTRWRTAATRASGGRESPHCAGTAWGRCRARLRSSSLRAGSYAGSRTLAGPGASVKDDRDKARPVCTACDVHAYGGRRR